MYNIIAILIGIIIFFRIYLFEKYYMRYCGYKRLKQRFLEKNIHGVKGVIYAYKKYLSKKQIQEAQNWLDSQK